jgi:hypothetical protein
MGQPAAAHVDVRPRLVERGRVAELVVELPRLRPGGPPKRLEVEGAGVEVLSTGLRALVGSETQWDVRLRAEAEPGRVPLVFRAVFADGKSVEVKDALTVVPAAEEGSFPWAAAGAGVALVLGASAGALALARRRSW